MKDRFTYENLLKKLASVLESKFDVSTIISDVISVRILYGWNSDAVKSKKTYTCPLLFNYADSSIWFSSRTGSTIEEACKSYIEDLVLNSNTRIVISEKNGSMHLLVIPRSSLEELCIYVDMMEKRRS